MNDLVREIEEDIARERWGALWQRYGKLAIGLVAALLIGTAGMSAWNGRQARLHAAEGETFARAAALEADTKYEAAAEAFKPLAAARDGYPALALLRRASALAAAGKTEEALALNDALARASSVRREWRDIAIIHAAGLRLDTKGALDADARAALKDAASEGRAFRASAQELLALDALAAKNPQEAATHLKAIVENAASPQMLAKRAETLLQSTGAGQSPTPKEAPKP